MFRGLLAFALATCVVGAPVATDACQAVCATRSAEAATQPAGGQHHSCHADAPPSGPALTSVHVCGHAGELPRVDRPEQGTAALAIMPTVAVAALESRVMPPRVASIQLNPPPLVPLASPLRV